MQQPGSATVVEAPSGLQAPSTHSALKNIGNFTAIDSTNNPQDASATETDDDNDNEGSIELYPGVSSQGHPLPASAAGNHLRALDLPGSSRPVSPTDQGSDENPENSGDLQFKKKEFLKSRTQLFQSVLSSASLKSLKHQLTMPSQPQLKRNPSTISQLNTKNFQSFIQAPVLLLVTNLRTADNVEIGQRLPFDQFQERRSRGGLLLEQSSSSAAAAAASSVVQQGAKAFDGKPVGDDETDSDEDNYKEETTLQQQRLTLNALKKLSLSLAPIIRSDEDDQGPQSRQLTTKLLNSSRPEGRLELTRPVRDLRPVLRSAGLRKSKPYQPAEVDLSSFSNLTRQSKHGSVAGGESRPASVSQRTTPNVDPQVKERKQAQVQPESESSQSQRSESLSAKRSEKLLQLRPQTQSQQPRMPPPQIQPQSQLQTRAPMLKTNLNTPKTVQTDRLGASETENARAATSVYGRVTPHKNALLAANLLPRKSEHDGHLKFINNLGPAGPGRLSRNTSETKIPSARNSQNLMRTVQLSTTLTHWDITGRNHGQPPEMLHASSFSSLKLHGLDRKLQQINGFRSPMYVPAVLRKTLDQTLDADPQSEHHVDTSETRPRESGSPAASAKSVDLAVSLEPNTVPSYFKTGPYELTQRLYDCSLSAPPMRKHWLKDEMAIQCGINTCRKRFSFFERRHHCRKCGGIFCKEHTSHFLYINHMAQFTTGGRGTLSRVCDNCIGQYNEFMKHEFGVTCHKPLSRESLPPQSALGKVDYRKEMVTSKLSNNLPIKNPDSGGDTKAADQLVGSVPANWSWSSF